MSERSKAIAGAFIAMLIVDVAGVIFFFAPIAAGDSAGAPFLPPVVGIIIYISLAILLLDWLSQQMDHPVKAAMTIAVSQFLLVDVDFVLRGDRGVATGAASAVLLFVSWGTVGMVYRRLLPTRSLSAGGVDDPRGA